MGRKTERLTAIGVKKLTKPGYHADGNNLYLQVSASFTKSWIFRYSHNKKPREMGLGPYPEITLGNARALAAANRLHLINSIDPITFNHSAKLLLKEQRTFEQCARELYSLRLPSWKNTKHAAQWISTLVTFAFSVFGDKPVSEVNKTEIAP